MTKKRTALGRRLASDRKQLGMTQRKLERLSGVSNAFISQIETGYVRDISLTMCKKLARGLKCDAAWLAGFK